MLRQVETSQRKTRMIGFEVDGTGTAAMTTGSKDATLVDNGTGNYTLTFTKPATRAITAVATSKTAALYCVVTALSTTSVTVKSHDAAGTATDADFYLMVMLADAGES
jgi:hypothetical protein